MIESISQPRQISKGKDGMTEVVDLVINFLRREYPTIQKGEDEDGQLIEDKMIKSIDQVAFVSPSQLSSIAQANNPVDDSVMFRLLKYSGIPEEALMGLMYHAENNQVYCNPYTPSLTPDGRCTKAYLSEDYLGHFSSDEVFERTNTAFSLGVSLALLNLRLAPKPLEVKDHLKPKFRAFLTDTGDSVISYLESSHPDVFSERFDVEGIASIPNIEIAKRFITNLINWEGSDYNPRIVAFGCEVFLVLPHQGLTNAEIVTGGTLDTDIRFRLAKPVFDDLFDYLSRSMGAEESRLRTFDRDHLFDMFVPGFKEGLSRGSQISELLKLRNLRNLFHDYKESKIPVLLAEAKRGGLSLVNLL